ncbi:unnamed protein product [Effrenium voratum]|nr:unnamed protein product [Effrenium voratum]
MSCTLLRSRFCSEVNSLAVVLACQSGVMPISILTAPHSICAIIQYGYPAVQYIRKVKEREEMSTIDYVQFTVYAVICSIWLYLEPAILWVLVDYCPLYLEMKILFFLWLASNEHKGAAWLWYKHIQPAHKSLDDKYYEPLMAMVMKMKLDMPATHTPASEVSDKNEVLADQSGLSKS